MAKTNANGPARPDELDLEEDDLGYEDILALNDDENQEKKCN